MKKSKLIALSLGAVLITGLGLLSLTGRVSAKKVVLNTRDLPEDNLFLVGPTNPSFEEEVSRVSAHKSDEQKDLIHALKAFSIFIKNESSIAVIAYALRWDMTRSDGTTISHVRSYA